MLPDYPRNLLWGADLFDFSNSPAPPPFESDAPIVSELPGQGREVRVLDARDLDPPEPIVRTLLALDALAPGSTLVQLGRRVPDRFVERLAELGYTCAVVKDRPDLVRLFIRHSPAGDRRDPPRPQFDRDARRSRTDSWRRD